MFWNIFWARKSISNVPLTTISHAIAEKLVGPLKRSNGGT
jgi:hypothetical protein